MPSTQLQAVGAARQVARGPCPEGALSQEEWDTQLRPGRCPVSGEAATFPHPAQAGGALWGSERHRRCAFGDDQAVIVKLEGVPSTGGGQKHWVSKGTALGRQSSASEFSLQPHSAAACGTCVEFKLTSVDAAALRAGWPVLTRQKCRGVTSPLRVEERQPLPGPSASPETAPQDKGCHAGALSRSWEF